MSKITRHTMGWSKLAVFAATTLLLGAVFAAGWFAALAQGNPAAKTVATRSQSLIDQDKNKPQTISFAPFWEAWSVVDNYFYGNADKQARVDGAISGMLLSLDDPYSIYLPKEESDLFQTDLSGQFSGIGAEIGQINGYPTIVSPLPGSPAEQAGAKPKDIILKVDDQSTENENFAKVINRIRGEKGSTVTLTVAREGNEQPIVIPIVRELVELPSVKSEVRVDQGLTYGYLQISQFLEDTASQVAAVLRDFNKQGVNSIVIDVRNDPGGLLNQAVDIASLFVDGGTKPEFDRTVVWQKDRNQNFTAYRLTLDPIAVKPKLVVLVNDGSASAAEIFAGALRDYGRAQLIGSKTFGKGSVQELHDLTTGGSLKITIAKWLTPNKSEIDKQGIEPDIKVESQEDDSPTDEVLQRALDTLR